MTGAKVEDDVPPPVEEAPQETPQDDDPAVTDAILGMKYATLAMTDDKMFTLRKLSKNNPHHVDALKIVIGEEKEVFKPLSYLLRTYMDLECDHIFHSKGNATKGGEALDVHGYIAHNDEAIVLAYRCPAPVVDWLSDINAESCPWDIPELNKDVDTSFGAFLRALADGTACCGDGPKPMVHAGFYNAFMSTLPLIKEYVDPLLEEGAPPRKLYVVGHSLGAGIATLAATYCMFNYDWKSLPHSMVSVSAGSPRTCLTSMKDHVDPELRRRSKKVSFLRIVRGNDVVTTVPPALLEFQHVGRLVFIHKDGAIDFHKRVSEGDSDSTRFDLDHDKKKKKDASNEEEIVKYEQVKKEPMPESFRDHMPDVYLAPLRDFRPKMFPSVQEKEEKAEKKASQSRFALFGKKNSQEKEGAPKGRSFRRLRKSKSDDASVSSSSSRFWSRNKKKQEVEEPPQETAPELTKPSEKKRRFFGGRSKQQQQLEAVPEQAPPVLVHSM